MNRLFIFSPEPVLREQLRYLRRNLRLTIVASVISAVATTWALSHFVPVQVLFYWLASNLLITLLLCLVELHPMSRRRSVRAAAITQIISMGIVGCAWGSLALVSARYGSQDALMLSMAILAGICSGGISLGGAIFLAYLAFLTGPAVMIIMGFIATQANFVVPMVILTSLYFLMTCLQAYSTQTSTLRTIVLLRENNDLLEQVQRESHDAHRALVIADQANKDRTKFLAAASHDLRQPMHALGLFLEALNNTALSDQQKKLVSNSQTSSQAAGDMLNTLLDYSRLEAGVLKSQPKAFSVDKAMHAWDSAFRIQAQAKNLRFLCHYQAVTGFADPSLVSLIMTNLLANALRYTNRGGVLLACRKRGSLVHLEVWDTGLGIAADQHQEIFKEFTQLSNPERDRNKGLGLGLAIVRRLADQMGAQVFLRSEPGRGSVFRLEIPVSVDEVVNDLETQPPLDFDFTELRILVVDDDQSVREAMRALLSTWGCHCVLADSVSTAVDMARAHRPELVISDYRLRDHFTGADVIDAIRQAMSEPKLPCIIITGDTAPQRLREAQNTDALLLHKPVLASELRIALATATTL